MTDPTPFVIPPDLPADVMQYERGWNACLAALAPEPATAGTPSSRWSADGKPDPHGTVYDCERARLAHGDMTDDELANEVFLCNHRGGDFARIGLLTAAKDRIRWLSRRLEEAKATPAAAVPDHLTASMGYHPEYAKGWNDRGAAAPNRPADAQRGKIAQVLKLLDNVTALQASEDCGLCEAIELLQGESALSADRIRTVLKLLGNVTAPTDDQADFLGQAEIVLENMLDASDVDAQRGVPVDAWLAESADAVRERIEEGGGFWRTCSGCHETEDGHDVGHYPYSTVLQCKVGSGCGECGGIGAIWDTTDYEDMGKYLAASPADPLPASEVSRG